MTSRFALILLLLATISIPLSGCNSSNDSSTTSKSAGGVNDANAEAELARQTKAMQRTIAEGVATGAVVGTLLGALNDNESEGFSVGVTVGAAAGTYVAALQRRYFTKEKKLEKVRDDINAANAELAASIATMQAVLDLQRRQLEELKATNAGKRELRAEIKEAETNLANMQSAIKSASGWEQEFASTRSLKLVKGQVTGVDAELAELSRRISTMKNIADTMAGTI